MIPPGWQPESHPDIDAAIAKFIDPDLRRLTATVVYPIQTLKNLVNHGNGLIDIGIVGNPDELVTSHIVTATGLEPNTRYHYQLRSKTPLGNEARTTDATFTTPSVAPRIEEISIQSVDEHEATVSFTTNIPTDTQIRLTNLTSGDITTQGEESFRTQHAFEVTDLEPLTPYLAEIIATDEFDQQAISSGIPFNTSTDDIAPTITGVRTEGAGLAGGKVQIIVAWNTDEPSTSQVVWTEGVGEDAEERRTLLNTDLVKNHVIVSTQFQPARLYKIQVESADAAGNTTRSPEIAVFTPREEESVLQLIIGTFESTFDFLR